MKFLSKAQKPFPTDAKNNTLGRLIFSCILSDAFWHNSFPVLAQGHMLPTRNFTNLPHSYDHALTAI